MEPGQILFYACVFFGAICGLVGFATRKVTLAAIGCGMLIVVIYALTLPEGAAWMHP